MIKKINLTLSVVFFMFSNAIADWKHSNGNYNGTNLSQLSQINKDSIANLEKDWIYNSGSIKDKNSVQATPIFTGKYLIISTLHGEMHAIKPDTGKLVWKKKLPPPVGRRGFAFNDGTIFTPTSKGVVAINENDGLISLNIGNKGFFGEDISLVPPIVYDERVYVATLNNGIQSFNLKNGTKIWHTKISPKNIAPSDGKLRIWSGFSLDEQTKTLFVVTSNMGGIVGNDRNKNQEDYSSSLIAINAIDGKILWSYQDVKNDLWDFDVVGPPLITDIVYKNKKTRIVIALSKTGNVIIYDINKKKLLYDKPYELIEAPPSDVKNVFTTNFQKKFIKPKQISKIYFDPKRDLNFNDKESKDFLEFKLRNAKYGKFLPPSLNNDIVTFGLHGGPSWPGFSLSADRKKIIITVNEYPWFIRLFYRDKIYSKLNIYSNKISNFFKKNEKKRDNKARWENNEIGNENADKIYSLLPVLGRNKTYLSKCASCHGVAGQGFAENESFGDKYYPPLAGITLTKKFKNIENLESLEFAHKYEKNFEKLSNSEFIQLKSFLKKRDKFLDKFNLFAINGKWQIFLDNRNLPASKPPWGKIIAIDIESAKKTWEVPFGEDFFHKGIKIKGLQNFGGTLNIGSNIFFATGTTDEKIYAFDVFNGEKIWEDSLPAAGSAPPMTFKYKGCQYIIINSTGGRFVGFKKNLDATVAYKLNTCNFLSKKKINKNEIYTRQ